MPIAAARAGPSAFQPSPTPAMACGIDAALEPVGDIVGVRETRRLRRLRRGKAALAAAADEVDVVLRR